MKQTLLEPQPGLEIEQHMRRRGQDQSAGFRTELPGRENNGAASLSAIAVDRARRQAPVTRAELPPFRRTQRNTIIGHGAFSLRVAEYACLGVLTDG